MEELEHDCACRRLQDHERIEGCDAFVAAHVCHRVPAAACCEMERDRGVGGGDLVVAVEVAFRWCIAAPWSYEWIPVHTAATRNVAWIIADTISIGVCAVIIGVVVALGVEVPLIGAAPIVCIAPRVVDEIIVVDYVAVT